MTAYIAKRILLMLPTLFGVMVLTFVVTQFVPGGPVQQYIAEARRGVGGDTGAYRGGQGVDPKKIAEIKALYGFDKPPLERPAAVPPHPPEGIPYMTWPMMVWWARMPPKTSK